MSADILPFRRRPVPVLGNCARCGAILERGESHTKHDCDAELETLAAALRANGHTEHDDDLPADLRQLLRDTEPKGAA